MSFNKPYEFLTIKDQFMFGKIAADPKNAEIILSSLLNRNISLSASETEHRIQLLSEKKYVQLDLLAIGEDGTNYDAEMQNRSSNQDRQKELPKRSRYYQCMLDGQMLDAGKDYLELANTFIIFICDFDPFGAQLYQYTFLPTCKEDGSLLLDDGTVRIFFNLTADISSAPLKTRNMLEYIRSGETIDESTAALEDAVSHAREVEEWRQEYMLKSIHENDIFKEGKAEGEEKTLHFLVQKGIITPEEAKTLLAEVKEASLK